MPSHYSPAHCRFRRRFRHPPKTQSGSASSTATRRSRHFLSLTRRAWKWRSTRSTSRAACWARKLEIVSRDDGGNPGRRGARRRGTRDGGRHQHSLRHVPFQCRTCGHRIRRQEESLLPRRRAADRQDHLGERQPLYVPAAVFDLHAGRHADARRARGQEEALGAGLSELRIRPVRGRRIQGD